MSAFCVVACVCIHTQRGFYDLSFSSSFPYARNGTGFRLPSCDKFLRCVI